ncbi:hypothetical protein ONS95_003101 [Cadophora gregata]|uniref:uncharacterized protein n=1 Tax=Cadophora gregata TaxID=51156 RepID=UPI0026DCFBEB|nr:uncharacterized protein ONS95_003101 [Cadophora gregata]KAK0108285.1 hypothetical protein ONS95_003101 [Cadophora gregata]
MQWKGPKSCHIPSPKTNVYLSVVHADDSQFDIRSTKVAITLGGHSSRSWTYTRASAACKYTPCDAALKVSSTNDALQARESGMLYPAEVIAIKLWTLPTTQPYPAEPVIHRCATGKSATACLCKYVSNVGSEFGLGYTIPLSDQGSFSPYLGPLVSLLTFHADSFNLYSKTRQIVQQGTIMQFSYQALKLSSSIEEDNAGLPLEAPSMFKSVLRWWKVAVHVFVWASEPRRVSRVVQKLRLWRSAMSPALKHISFENHYFDGFYDTSPFKGQPDAPLDDEWNKLIRSQYSSIKEMKETDAMTEKLHKNSTYVTLPDDQGGGYLGNLEVYHQLHCLNFIRQYTYEDYYRDPARLPMEFTDSDGVLRNHVDHCIDYLRQLIMCTGDVGVHTYFWMKGRDFPFPDFIVERKCRAWKSVEEYAIKARGNITLPTSWSIRA